MNRYKMDLKVPPLWLLQCEIDQQQHDCIFGPWLPYMCNAMKQFTLIFSWYIQSLYEASYILFDGLHEDFRRQYLLQGLIG